MAENRKQPYDPDESARLDELVASAFSEWVRRERRNLVLFASVSLFVAITGVTPSEAGILGLSFPEGSAQKNVSVFLLLATGYFLAGFWIYASPEYKAARAVRRKQQRERLLIESNRSLRHIALGNFLGAGRYNFWITYEYNLPRWMGVLAIGALVWRLTADA